MFFDIFFKLFLIQSVFKQTNCSADSNEILKGTETRIFEISLIEILTRFALFDFLNNTGPTSGISIILV